MSKIFLIGDVHLALGYPNSADKWLKVHKEYFNGFLIPLLKNQATKDDIIVQLGDFFDNRNIIPINLLNYGMDIIEELSKISPTHLIIGNHDIWSKSASEVNSVRPFKYMPNVKIYDKPDVLIFNNLKILMLPYIEKRIEQIKIIQENKDCDYLFCHSDLNGCRMHLTSIANKNADKIDIEEFKPFKKVKSGHIHIVQTKNQFNFVGSIFQMDRNDYNDQKGITVIDTSNDTEHFIPNNISPIFKKIKIINEDDIEKLDKLKNTKDYIDISISNNLLINNRKFRRKLEMMLETGNFSSVEYIDDITNELVEGEDIDIQSIDNNPINEDLDISVKLEYEDYIKEYILNQKYDNDDFKKGIISEFDEIARIYEEEFKNKK
jgi:hypothetical protein